MTRPTTPRMPPIIRATPLARIRCEVFMTCQGSPLLWNAGDALEACPRDDAEDQVGNRLRPPPLSPRLVDPTGGSHSVEPRSRAAYAPERPAAGRPATIAQSSATPPSTPRMPQSA